MCLCCRNLLTNNINGTNIKIINLISKLKNDDEQTKYFYKYKFSIFTSDNQYYR